MVMGTGADKTNPPSGKLKAEEVPPDLSQRPSETTRPSPTDRPYPDTTSPSARAYAADKTAYAIAEEEAKKRAASDIEAAKERQATSGLQVGDKVKYLGLALEVTKVYEDNPNVIDLGTYERVSVWDAQRLVPEEGWEEHAAEAEGDSAGEPKSGAKKGAKGKSEDKDKDDDKDDDKKDKDDKAPSPYPPGPPGRPTPSPSRG
jgi:hypothetical protein